MNYVLDAYNIIHYVGIKGSDGEEVRRRFIQLLLSHKLFVSGKNKAFVVFDGFATQVPVFAASIEIIFSRDITADEKIERMLKRMRPSYVVSNDRQVMYCAKAFGHKPMAVEEFLRIGRATRQREDLKKQMSKDLLPKDIEEINRELEKIWLKKES